MKNKKLLFLLLFSLSSCGTGISDESLTNNDSSTPASETDSFSDENSSSTSGPGTTSGDLSTSSTTEPPSSSSSEPTTSLPTEKYYVTFVTNCETSLEQLYTNYIVSPPTLVNDNKTLEGWYFESSFTTRVTFPYVVVADVTFYAKWVDSVEGLNLQISEDNRGYEIVSYHGNSQMITMPSYYNSKPIIAIADYVFYENQTLMSVVFPNALESIGHFAFFNCQKITQLQLPDSLLSIGTSAFANVKVTQISFGNSLQVIGNSAFQNTAITTINLPNTVTEIGAYAFKNCINLQKIFFSSAVPPLIKYNSFEGSNVTLYVPNTYLSAYTSANVWKDFVDVISGY